MLFSGNRSQVRRLLAIIGIGLNFGLVTATPALANQNRSGYQVLDRLMPSDLYKSPVVRARVMSVTSELAKDGGQLFTLKVLERLDPPTENASPAVNDVIKLRTISFLYRLNLVPGEQALIVLDVNDDDPEAGHRAKLGGDGQPLALSVNGDVLAKVWRQQDDAWVGMPVKSVAAHLAGR
ncbi:MAG: hypothetical protein AAGF15_06080 [Pseudomonadota bacterium]